MPYIITTKRADLVSAQVRNMRGGLVISRRAVATLEEAREVAVETVRHAFDIADPFGHDEPLFMDAAYAIPESGGTVGSLPDGTVIEVAKQ